MRPPPPGASRSAQSSAIRLLVFCSRESTVAGHELGDLRHGANSSRYDERTCEESLHHRIVLFALLPPPLSLGVKGGGVPGAMRSSSV